MVSRSIQRHEKRDAGYWITDLEKRRTARNLSARPTRNSVVDKWIVHPFADFMTQRMNIFDHGRRSENAGVVGRRHGDCQLIRRASESRVESENAASSQLGEKRVVRQENRQTRR